MNSTKKTLIIPHYVTEADIPTIWHYFDYFNIAKVGNIKYYDHDDQIQYNSHYTYGFAIIEIDEWYNNTGGNNFYESIVSGKCRMVYDDPFYWNVEFYDDEIEENSVNHSCQDHESEMLNNCNTHNADDNDKPDVDTNSDCNDNESYYDYESGSEPDDPKDLDYEFKESDNEEDNYYEFYHKRLEKKVKTVKKNMTNKNSETNDKNIICLSDQLVKKNKNYLKNNKTKSFKNEWSRRLRRKLE